MISSAIDPARMEKVTPDGGVLKITLREGDATKPMPKWVRGANARFHYAVYAYLKENRDSHKPCAHVHSETGDNDDHSCCPKSHDTHQHDQHINGSIGPEDDNRPVRQKVWDTREENPNEPFELRIGYSFSVKGMEIAVKTMKVGERSRFLCFPEYSQGYVQLAKVLKQEKENRLNVSKGLPPKRIHGCCAHAMQEEMEKETELAALHGALLEFEIELLEVQMPDAYVREPWEMDTIDKYWEAPIRKDEGGKLYKEGRYEEALAKYTRALSLLESVATSTIVLDLQRHRMEREKMEKEGRNGREGSGKESVTKRDDSSSETEIDLDTLEELLLACRLNYAACKMKLQDYESVIAPCTEVLKNHPKNIKALFRRGQAYLRVGRDLDLAEKDLEKLESVLETGKYSKSGAEWIELRKEQQMLQAKLRAHTERERKMFANIFKA